MVLIQPWGASPRPCRSHVHESERIRHHLDAILTPHSGTSHGLWVLECLAQGLNGGTGHADGLQCLDPFAPCPGKQDIRQRVVDEGSVQDTPCVLPERGFLDEIRSEEGVEGVRIEDALPTAMINHPSEDSNAR